MTDYARQEEEAIVTGARPFRVMSEEQAGAIQKWREGGFPTREDLFIGLLAAGVVLAVLLVAATVLTAAPSPQNDTERGAPQRGVEPRLERLSRNLGLSEEQKAKIRPILEQEHQELTSLREDTSVSPREKHAKFRAIHEATTKRITPILTAEQQQKWEGMRKRMRHRRPAPGGDSPEQ